MKTLTLLQRILILIWVGLDLIFFGYIIWDMLANSAPVAVDYTQSLEKKASDYAIIHFRVNLWFIGNIFIAVFILFVILAQSAFKANSKTVNH